MEDTVYELDQLVLVQRGMPLRYRLSGVSVIRQHGTEEDSSPNDLYLSCDYLHLLRSDDGVWVEMDAEAVEMVLTLLSESLVNAITERMNGDLPGFDLGYISRIEVRYTDG